MAQIIISTGTIQRCHFYSLLAPESQTIFHHKILLLYAVMQSEDLTRRHRSAVATFIHAWRYMMFEFKAWIDQTARRNGKHRINAAD